MTTTEDAARLAEIQDRLAKATPGPWRWTGKSVERYTIYAKGEFTGWRFNLAEMISGGSHDADLIANAPADLAWLITEVERLRRELDER